MVAARRFTLLNVVVVLLVVCFGLVLFMYYVARQRWAAQQQATTTRMVLLYQAIDQFETAQGVYPGYRVTQAIDGTGNPVPASWAFAILPYLDNPEAQAIHQQYGSQGPEATRGQKPDLRLADFIAPGVSRPGPILSFVVNAALPDGRAIAVKVADGGGRARTPVTIAALRSLGVDIAADALPEPVLGHGRPVGEVHALVGAS